MFKARFKWSQNGFVFLNAVILAHLVVNTYGNKLRVCNFATAAGTEGWESYPSICVSEVCAYVYVCVCVCVSCTSSKTPEMIYATP